MKINLAQFNLNLLTPPKPIYCISGDDYILIQEIVDHIIEYFQQKKFDMIRKQISPNFSCQQLVYQLKSLDLFACHRLFIVTCSNIQWLKNAEDNFKHYINTWQPHTILILCLPKLEKTQQQHSCIKFLENYGLHIQIWPLNNAQFRTWLRKKVVAAELNISDSAFLQLLQHVEGNLNSANQEVNKLKMQFGTKQINIEDIHQCVNFAQHYNVFKVVEYCLSGENINKIAEQLICLKNDGVEPLIILGVLTYELRQLLSHKELSPTQKNYEKYRIALKRQPSLEFWWLLLAEAHIVDQHIKSNKMKLVLIWDQLIKIFLSIAEGV